MLELSSKMRCNRKRAGGCYCARELEDEEGGCVGTGFVPREGKMRVASAPKLLEARGAVLMRTMRRREGIWVRGVTASPGRGGRALAQGFLERPLAWERAL